MKENRFHWHETYVQRDIRAFCCWHQCSMQAAISGLKGEPKQQFFVHAPQR